MENYSRVDNWSASEPEEAVEPIASTPVVIFNGSQGRLAAIEDRQVTARLSDPVVILVSGYGKTKSSHLRLSYYLVQNGFQVFRYDHSNHIGESDGPILFTTLSQMAADLGAVIDFVAEKCRGARIGIVAESLGARSALRVAAADRRVRFFASLIGVFDVQGTLKAIYNEDGFAEKMRGVRLGIRDIIGFQVDSDHFILDAYQNGYHSLETAECEAASLQAPTYFFVADNDPWVNADSVRKVFTRVPASRKKIFMLPGVMHELYENPNVAADTCCEIVRAAKQSLIGNLPDLVPIRIPSETLLSARSRLEKRARPTELKTAEEKLFWSEYLEKYAYIVKLQDYWNLLDSIGTRLGGWRKGDTILDAGCGIGNFGAFLLVRNLYQALQLRTASLRRKPWIHYLGIDFVQEALQQAKSVHHQIQEEFNPKIAWISRDTPMVEFSYSTVDLDVQLPFSSQSFDKVVSNLVLSYVRDPEFTLAELCRVLKAGGRVLISSLKPNADLSQIYRSYASVSRTEEEMRQARMVLSNAGLIRHKEAEGFYQFFSESQLGELLEKNGCHNIVTFRSFGDQANVAVGDKPRI